MQIDTLKLYTATRLTQWGIELRSGGGVNLDFPSINILHAARYAVPRGSGTVISDEAMLTETVVNEVGLEAPESAVILRCTYCTRQRFVESKRRDAERVLCRKLSRRAFWTLHDDGFQRVRDFFEFLLRAAA